MIDDVPASLYLFPFPKPSASISNSGAEFANTTCQHECCSAFCPAASCPRSIARVSTACSTVCCLRSACPSVNCGTCSPVIRRIWEIKEKQKARPTVLLYLRTVLAAVEMGWESGTKTARNEHGVKGEKSAKACGGQSRYGYTTKIILVLCWVRTNARRSLHCQNAYAKNNTGMN